MELPLDDPVVAGLLEQPNLMRLAYLGFDDRPRVVPIWFLHKDGGFTVITGPKAYKAKAIARNGAVSCTIDSATPPYHVLLVHGDATVETTDGMAEEYRPIVERYLAGAADAYLKNMRIKEQRRIRIMPSRYTILDFQQRFPQSLR
jgi:nitroimidazol reductase NimA-like FMN-containing flavoprotein (pyridoxamine 5'-phosphate oxidase superfamily)